MRELSCDRGRYARSEPAADVPFAPAFASHDGQRTLIWLFGEHDISNRDAVSALIDQAIMVDDTEVEVNLSRLQFMSAATVRLIVDARQRLRLQSRSLTLVAPTPRASRVLELCGVAAQAPPSDPAPSAKASRQ